MKESFSIIIDSKKFRWTNFIWNELNLNSPYRVGYVSTLVESKTFKSKEDWRDFYYQSGKDRLKKLSESNLTTKDISHPKWKELATSHGRTEEELKELGQYMFKAIQQRGNPLGISLPECVWMVKYRVIGETWNGIILREKNTIQTLQQFFPSLIFKSTTGEEDLKYAIDYSVYDVNHSLVAALQIKPKSYDQGTLPVISQTKKINFAKNKQYYEEFGVPVLYVYASSKGRVLNQNVIQELTHIESIHNKKIMKIS